MTLSMPNQSSLSKPLNDYKTAKSCLKLWDDRYYSFETTLVGTGHYLPIHLCMVSGGVQLGSLENSPSVYCEYLTTHVEARSTRQVHYGAFEVVWESPSACWYPIQDGLRSVLIFDECFVHISADVAGGNLSASAFPPDYYRNTLLTALTLIPAAAHWLERLFVSCATPPFAAAYA